MSVCGRVRLSSQSLFYTAFRFTSRVRRRARLRSVWVNIRRGAYLEIRNGGECRRHAKPCVHTNIDVLRFTKFFFAAVTRVETRCGRLVRELPVRRGSLLIHDVLYERRTRAR